MMRKGGACARAAITALAVCSLYPGCARAEQEKGRGFDSFGAWLWDYLYNGASVTAGIGARQADVQVIDKATNASGKISQRDSKAYFLSYSTRPSFIGTSKVGYNFVFNYTTFSMNQQEVAKNDYRDVGTRMHGRVAYFVPTLFYQFGEHGPKGAYARAGLGLGLGAAKYEGSIILDYPNNTMPISVSSGNYDLKIASSLYLEGRYRNWGFTITGAGPSYEDERYRYNVADISAYFSYMYYFP